MTTYRTIEERDQLRRKEAADEACRRVQAAGGPDKMPYAKALHGVHRERGIRLPTAEPETPPARQPATRVPQPVLQSLVKEACRRVEAAGGVHKYSYESALSDVKKDRGVSSASNLITPEAVQKEYRIRGWHPLPESVADLARIVRSASYPMGFRVSALTQLRTEQGDDRPTTEFDVRRFALGQLSQGE